MFPRMLRPLVVVLAWALVVSAAHAAAPMQKTQAPGFYRMMLGDFELTALSDGTVKLPFGSFLTNIAPEEAKARLAQAFLADPIEASVNAFLVNTGDKLVMIDTGAGAMFGPTVGKLVASLKAAGYDPSQVDEIYITHMHSDHIGGLVANGQRVFPNATIRVHQRDADAWLDPKKAASASGNDKRVFEGAKLALGPYIESGRLHTILGDGELVPGIRALGTSGHTPGHTVYVVESKGERMYVIGDLMHVGAVQFAAPAVAITFDSDQKAAVAQRQKIFALAEKEGALLAIAHVPFPGMGRLRKTGEGYVFVPVNYSVPQ